MSLWSFMTTAVKGGLDNTPLGMLANAATNVIGGAITQNIANKQQQRNQERQNAWQHNESEIARNWQAEQAQLQNEWSEKMNLQQQQWQEGMWNKTNEWNSEGARMQRLLDAGVNPNNAAGLISGNQTAAQLAQQPQIPTANPYPSTAVPSGGQMSGPTIIDGMNSMANVQMQAAQARLINAQAENQEIRNGYQAQVTETEINQMLSTISANTSVANKNDADANYIRDYMGRLAESTIGKNFYEAIDTWASALEKFQNYANLQQELENKKEEKKNLEKEGKNIDANTSLAQQKEEESRSNTALNGQLANESKSREEQNQAVTRGQEIDNQIKEKDKELKGLEVHRQEKRNEIIDDTGIDPDNQNQMNTVTRILKKGVEWLESTDKKATERKNREKARKQTQKDEAKRKSHNMGGSAGHWNP